MSEFSESYHLVATSADDGVALLRRGWPAGAWCSPKTEDGVTALSDEPLDFAHGEGDDGRVLMAWAGDVSAPALERDQVLVWYANFEDHGWAFVVRKAPPRSPTTQPSGTTRC